MCSPELNEAVDNLETDITHLDYAVKQLIQANTDLKQQLDESNRLLEIYRSIAREEDNV